MYFVCCRDQRVQANRRVMPGRAESGLAGLRQPPSSLLRSSSISIASPQSSPSFDDLLPRHSGVYEYSLSLFQLDILLLPSTLPSHHRRHEARRICLERLVLVGLSTPNNTASYLDGLFLILFLVQQRRHLSFRHRYPLSPRFSIRRMSLPAPSRAQLAHRRLIGLPSTPSLHRNDNANCRLSFLEQ